MSLLPVRIYIAAMLLALPTFAPAWAQELPADEPTEPALETEADAAEEMAEDEGTPDSETPRTYRIRNAEIVRIGADAHLAPDESANTVVAIFGSAISEGEAREDIVTVFGNARVTGPVGASVTSVFGDAYVDSRVDGDVIAVFGDLELGPNANVGGEVVVFAGTLERHPDAVVHRGVQDIGLAGEFGQLRWITPWIQHCLLLGRPLALHADLQWAWWLAFGFLGLYTLISLLFSDAVGRCVTTLEERPGETTIASIATVFLSPLFMFLLAITVIGALFVPLFLLALFVAGLFGKAVVLAALGRRVTRFADSGPLAHVAVATAIGGLIVTALYLVPVFGFLLFMLIAILGLGVVAYTLVLAMRARAPIVEAAPVAGVTAPGATTTSEPSAQLSGASDASSAASATAAASEPPVPPVPLNALPRASFWVRMGALAIDAVLIAVIARSIPGSGDLWLFLLATYGAVMWKLKGTTVGGIICNLRIVRADGREVDWATSIVRALGCFLSLFAVGLGFIWIAVDRERQGWHDKIAGTLVVRTPKGTPLV